MSILAETVARHRVAIALAGAVALVAGGWLAAGEYAQPVRETRTSETVVWTESAHFTYSVPVTRNSTHWPIGTVLPMGEPAYFRTISDRVDIQHTWTPALPDGARGVAASRLWTEVRAENKAGDVYWSFQRPLAQGTTQDAAAGIVLSAALELDPFIMEIAARQSELPTAEGGLNWTIRAEVVYAITAAGRDEQGASTFDMPVLFQDPRLTLPEPDEIAWERPHSEVVTRTTTAPAGVGGIFGALHVLGLLLTGIVLMGVAASAAHREANATDFDKEYGRFREWVSVAGVVPDSARRGALVDVRTLEDLVHLAADARTRVVLDAKTREFYALLPGVTYRYGRHATRPDLG